MTMCFPVSKCCFCVSLEVGTKIISLLSLLCCTAAVAAYGGAAVSTSVPSAAHTKQCFYLLVVAIALLQVLFCGLLVYGAFWSKPSYMWPWLVTSWLACGGLLLLSLLGAVLLTVQYVEDEDTFADVTTMSTFYFVYAAILYYCSMVVHSRRMQLVRAQETESADSLLRRKDIAKNLIV